MVRLDPRCLSGGFSGCDVNFLLPSPVLHGPILGRPYNSSHDDNVSKHKSCRDDTKVARKQRRPQCFLAGDAVEKPSSAASSGLLKSELEV